MRKEIYKEGGLFDQAVGDDGRMSLQEAKDWDSKMRKMAEMQGEKLPTYSEKEFMQVFNAYDSLSEGDGFTKTDSWIAQGIMDKLRDHRISDREIDKYWALAELYWYDHIEELDDDSKVKKAFNAWLQNGYTDEQNKMIDDVFKNFDKDNSGRLDRHEYR